MTSFKHGDVVLAHVVFTDGTSTKKRPAIVISGSKYHKEREEIVVVAISSNTKRTLFGDVLLQEWQSAGLLYPSTATGIFFTIKKDLVERRLGALTIVDLTALENNLQKILEISGKRLEKKEKNIPEEKKRITEKEKMSSKGRKTAQNH